jgi:cystathionine beta-synthase
VQLVLADPVGSGLATYAATGKLPEKMTPWLVEGIGGDSVPPVGDFSRVAGTYSISDAEAFRTCRELLKKEGIIAGTSTGTLLAAALRFCRVQRQPQRVVTFVCDSGNKYLSKMFNDFWMRDQGFLRGEPRGDLRDVISRSAEKGSVVSVSPTDTLLVAHARMKLSDVSQLPVLDKGKIVGILDESDVLLAVSRDEGAWRHSAKDFMTGHLETVQVGASLESILPLLRQGMVAIVCEGDRFLGLITRIDVSNYLRRQTR